MALAPAAVLWWEGGGANSRASSLEYGEGQRGSSSLWERGVSGPASSLASLRGSRLAATGSRSLVGLSRGHTLGYVRPRPAAAMGLPQQRLATVLARVQPVGPVLSPEARAATYERGLAEGEEVLGAALAPSTVRRHDSSAGELGGWLVSSGSGRGLHDCTPDDLVVYMTTWFLVRHSGRSGGKLSPSAVQSHLAALSGFFARIGRSGRYDYAAGRGNPVDSIWVDDFRTGYQRQQVQAGYQECSAVPMTEGKYRSLVLHLWGQFRLAVSVLSRLVLLRDLLCIQLLWQTAARGHDVGKVGLGDFVDPVFPDRPFAGFPLRSPTAAGARLPSLCLRLRGTKTYRLSRAPPMTLPSKPEDPLFCFPSSLSIYLSLCRRPDAPPGALVEDLLFRPLDATGGGFKARAMSSSTLGARLRLHLRAAGLYEGETVHSFRRGTLQAASGGGASSSALLELGQMRSAATLARYLDPGRHERVVRARL